MSRMWWCGQHQLIPMLAANEHLYLRKATVMSLAPPELCNANASTIALVPAQNKSFEHLNEHLNLKNATLPFTVLLASDDANACTVILPLATHSAVPQPFNLYSIYMWIRVDRVTQSLHLAYMVGEASSLPGCVPPMTWSAPNLWWVLNLVSLVW